MVVSEPKRQFGIAQAAIALEKIPGPPRVRLPGSPGVRPWGPSAWAGVTVIRDELRPMESVSDPRDRRGPPGALHAGAIEALRSALARYLDGGPPPDATERLQFRYPELRLTYQPDRADAARPPRHRQVPGTRHLRHHRDPAGAFSRPTCWSSCGPWCADYGVEPRGRPRAPRRSPIPTWSSRAPSSARGGVTPRDLATYFPVPLLSVVGDEIADGLWHDLPEATAPAGAVRRGPDRLLAAPPRALHRQRLAATCSPGSC